jgi:integrase
MPLPLATGFRQRYILHSIRHTVTSELICAGVDHVVRHEILGHEHERLEERVYGQGVAETKARCDRAAEVPNVGHGFHAGSPPLAVHAGDDSPA